MRMVLRSAARLARALAWLLKAALLLAAVGVLVLWAMSRGQSLGLRAQRFDLGADGAEYQGLDACCDHGWIVAGQAYTRYPGGTSLPALRRRAALLGEGWNLEPFSRPSDGPVVTLPWVWGPFRGSGSVGARPDVRWDDRRVAAPCWLVAPALAAWPLASVALLLRRRVRRDRRGRLGLCDGCGYDLRAGAARDGTLLERCPECGAATPGGGWSIADAQRDGR